MWILIIVLSDVPLAIDAYTASNLAVCADTFHAQEQKFGEIKEAYCQSATSNDRVYLVKNGKSLEFSFR